MDLYACSAIAVFVVYMERVLGGGEVAGILAVSRHTVVKWIKEGEIEARLGVKIDDDLVEKALKACEW